MTTWKNDENQDGKFLCHTHCYTVITNYNSSQFFTVIRSVWHIVDIKMLIPLWSIIFGTDDSIWSNANFGSTGYHHPWNSPLLFIYTVSSTSAFSYKYSVEVVWPPIWSNGQSSWLLSQRSRVRFPALPDFLSSSGSGKVPTQPLWR
jgi:hypothetical protein